MSEVRLRGVTSARPLPRFRPLQSGGGSVRQFDLVIFDCDGVLVDSEMLSAGVLMGMMAEVGLPITPEIFRADFLGRLGDHYQRASPAVLQGRQRPGDAHPASHVDIVAAGVHDADFLALSVEALDGTGIGQAGFLRDRQGIHVAADQQGRPRPVAEHAHHAVTADLGGDLEAELFQLGR